MTRFTFDTETHLLKPGLGAPKLVCLSARCDGQDLLLLADDGLRLLEKHLRSDSLIAGHNVWYDLGVAAAERSEFLPLIFQALEQGRIADTQVRQLLLDIASGDLGFETDPDTGEITKTNYHLADLTQRLLGKHLQKEDTWRLKYALLDGVPIAEWPEEARKYALDDAISTDEVFEAQERILDGDAIPDVLRQHRAAWALHLMGMWGIRTDPVATEALRAELTIEVEATYADLRKTDLIRTDKDGDHRVMKALYARVTKAYTSSGRTVPMTDGGKKGEPRPQTSKETLEESGDADLEKLAEVMGAAKQLTSFVPVLELGTQVPICPRFNVLVDTGRTSCSRPNLQQLPRKGKVRDCFVARPGTVFCFVDYDTLEMRSLAQVCLDLFGYSKLAEALRRGDDLHLRMAAQLLGVSYEEAVTRYHSGDTDVKDTRQMCKPANFGFPGGMKPRKFVLYAKKAYGVRVTEGQAEQLYEVFHASWPEIAQYLEHVKGLTQGGEGTIVQLRSGRVRGRTRYTAAANGFFQALAADGAKDALWHVAKECYLPITPGCEGCEELSEDGGEHVCVGQPLGPLFGSRPCVFVHDEIITEIPYDPARPEPTAAAADRQAQIMRDVMSSWLPDVPVTCKPVLAKRWYKGAEPAFVNGVLVPSKPRKEGKKTTWEADL